VLAKLKWCASAISIKLVLDKVAAEILGGKVSINGTLQNFKKTGFCMPALVYTGAESRANQGMVSKTIR
jgi:hypothetical protein